MTTATPSVTYNSCRLCNSTKLRTILDLGNPFVSNFVLPTDPDPIKSPLVLARCGTCGLGQLRTAVDPDVLYQQYWYQSGVNASMRASLAELVRDALHWGPTAGTWLDIGANDGTLFAAVPNGWHKIGVDPSQNIAMANADEVIRGYFSAISPPVQIITSAAMFYDLNDPHAFVDNIRKSLALGGVWVNQLSYTPTMLRDLAFDNICHEHVCYYDLTTLKALYSMHGLEVLDASLNDVNGGSIRVIATHKSDSGSAVADSVQRLLTDEATTSAPPAWANFAKRVAQWRSNMRTLLHSLCSQGKSIHVYGASTKGNTLLQYLDPTALDYAADRNPIKWGRQMVGSWLPIISEEESRRMQPDYYFVLPWAFKDEFVKREADFITRGGRLIFPLPEIEVVGG